MTSTKSKTTPPIQSAMEAQRTVFYRYWINNKGGKWARIPAEDAASTLDRLQPRYMTVLETTHDGEDGSHIDSRERGPLFIDIDVKEDQGGIEVATKAMLQILDNLKGHDVDLSQCHLFASGVKGYHIEVPKETFRAPEPASGTPSLAQIYREMVMSMYVDGIDINVYNSGRGRMWRVPNVQREDGAYKVSISAAEAIGMTPERYRELTSAPRVAVSVQPPTLAVGLGCAFAAAEMKVKERNAKRPKQQTMTPRAMSALTGPRLTIELVKNAALPAIETLVREWLEGDWKGDHFVGKNPMRGDRNGGSFIVWANGTWKDFADEDAWGGDLVSLYAYLQGWDSQSEAADRLAMDLDLNVDREAAKLKRDAQIEAMKERGELAPASSDGHGFVTYGADWLLLQEFKPPRAVVHGLLYEGLTILCGAPKVGKSWLALDLALCVAAGTSTLGGRVVQKGPVLYLTPDDTNRRRLKDRIYDVAATRHATRGAPHFIVANEVPRLGDGFEVMLKSTVESMTDGIGKPALIVLDTLAHIMPMGTRQQNQYLADVAALRIIKRFADQYDVAILVLHHDRKSEGSDVLDKVSGTKGLTGSADAIWMLNRIIKTDGKAAALFATGRDLEEIDLGLTFNSESKVWVDDGLTAQDLSAGEGRQQIMNLLRRSVGTEGVTAKEVIDHIKAGESAAQKILKRMVDDGMLTVSASKRGRATVYILP